MLSDGRPFPRPTDHRKLIYKHVYPYCGSVWPRPGSHGEGFDCGRMDASGYRVEKKYVP